MPSLIADHTFSIENSPLNSIRFVVDVCNFRFSINASSLAQLCGVQAALSALNINSDIQDDQRLLVRIDVRAPSSFNDAMANSIHAVLDRFSNHFGNDEELCSKIADTLIQKGFNLNPHRLRGESRLAAYFGEMYATYYAELDEMETIRIRLPAPNRMTFFPTVGQSLHINGAVTDMDIPDNPNMDIPNNF
jgi:hypothetical protein